MRRVLMLPLALALCAPAVAAGQDGGARPVAPYLDDEVIGVVRVDLSRFDADGFSRWLARVQRGEKDPVGQWGTLRAYLDGLVKAGARDVYVVLSLADLPEPPLVVLPVGKGADARALARAVRVAPLEGFEVAERGDAVVVGTEAALARLKGLKPKARPDLARALDAAGDATARVALAPTPVLRRS